MFRTLSRLNDNSPAAPRAAVVVAVGLWRCFDVDLPPRSDWLASLASHRPLPVGTTITVLSSSVASTVRGDRTPIPSGRGVTMSALAPLGVLVVVVVGEA